MYIYILFFSKGSTNFSFSLSNGLHLPRETACVPSSPHLSVINTSSFPIIPSEFPSWDSLFPHEDSPELIGVYFTCADADFLFCVLSLEHMCLLVLIVSRSLGAWSSIVSWSLVVSWNKLYKILLLFPLNKISDELVLFFFQFYLFYFIILY